MPDFHISMPFPAPFVSSCSAFFVDLVLLNKGSITLLSLANHSYTSRIEPTWVIYITTTQHHQQQHSPHFTVITLHTLISHNVPQIKSLRLLRRPPQQHLVYLDIHHKNPPQKATQVDPLPMLGCRRTCWGYCSQEENA